MGKQYERFMINEAKKHNVKEKAQRKFPGMAKAFGLRNRGINAYNESEVVGGGIVTRTDNTPSSVSPFACPRLAANVATATPAASRRIQWLSCARPASQYGHRQAAENDIDFEVTLGDKRILVRATSAEEKKLWVIALNGATTVRSFTSKNMDTHSQSAFHSIKDVNISDLDLGEILGSGSTGTVKLAVCCLSALHLPAPASSLRASSAAAAPVA